MNRIFTLFIAGFLFATILNISWNRWSPGLFHHYLFIQSDHQSDSESDQADILVFSYDRPLQLYAFLETVEKNVQGINELHVLYKTSEDRYEKGYEIVKDAFPNVVFHSEFEEKNKDFKQFVISITEESPSQYISYAVDDIIVTKPFNLSECISALNKYHAYVFINRAGLNLDYDHPLGKKNLSYYEVTQEGMCLWTLRNGVRIWRYPNYVDFSLHQKREVLPDLKKVAFKAPNTMEEAWASLMFMDILAYFPTNRVYLKPWTELNFKRALSYQDSKIVNIPINIVNTERTNAHMGNYSTEDLLMLFLRGYKLDTSLFEGYVNTRVHENIIPQFVLR